MKSRPLNSWFPSASPLVLSRRRWFCVSSVCWRRPRDAAEEKRVSGLWLHRFHTWRSVYLFTYLFSVWSVVSTAFICQSEQSHHEVHLVITVPELSAGSEYLHPRSCGGSSGVHVLLFYAALMTPRLLLGSDLGFKVASEAPEQRLNGPRDEDWFVVFCVEPNYFSIDRPAGSRPGAKPQKVIVVAFLLFILRSFAQRWCSCREIS